MSRIRVQADEHNLSNLGKSSNHVLVDHKNQLLCDLPRHTATLREVMIKIFPPLTRIPLQRTHQRHEQTVSSCPHFLLPVSSILPNKVLDRDARLFIKEGIQSIRGGDASVASDVDLISFEVAPVSLPPVLHPLLS